MDLKKGIAYLSLIFFLSGCSSGDQDQKPEGLRLLEVNGCIGCHSLDGSKRIGPTFKGLYGKEEEVVTSGVKQTLKADRDYLRRSIVDPLADVVQGFEPTMPTNFQNQLGEENLNIILDYLESLDNK